MRSLRSKLADTTLSKAYYYNTFFPYFVRFRTTPARIYKFNRANMEIKMTGKDQRSGVSLIFTLTTMRVNSDDQENRLYLSRSLYLSFISDAVETLRDELAIGKVM